MTQLPFDSIGPTDILAYRDCPRRYSYGIKRHVGIGKQSRDLTPEAGSWATDYGSAAHVVIHELDAGASVEKAIEEAWNRWGRRLEPDDLPALRHDADVYQARDFPNTRTIASEHEFRVPLFEYRGTQIYFRTRIDRLLERVDEPGTFIHVDYKSERHPKSKEEVRDNLQLWMTNWAVHEHWPEIEQLIQFYDQLRFGQQSTRKTAEARARIKEWTIRETIRVLEDNDVRDDGLLAPTKNDWCSWCPILESCPVVASMTEFAKVRVNALAPTVKRGRRLVADVEPDRIEEYIEAFTEAKDAQKILKRFVESVRELLAEMPTFERARLGYVLQPRKERHYSPQALERMHEVLGERFYHLVGVTKTQLESELADEPDLLAFAAGLAEEAVGSEALVAAK